MALRKTRHSDKERKSLKESSLSFKLTIPRRVRDDIKTFTLPKSVPSFAARHRRHGLKVSFQNQLDLTPYRFHEFRLINNCQFVLLDLWRINGIQTFQLMSLDHLNKEDYFHLIPGNEDTLVEMKYFTERFLKQNRIEDNIDQCDMNIGENAWHMSPMLFECENDTLKVSQKGMILTADFNTYYPQISPEFLFCPQSNDDEIQEMCSGYVYRVQLNKIGQFIHISEKDIIIENIRQCIRNNSNKYLNSELLSPQEYPLDTRIDTVWFGKRKELIHYALIVQTLTFPKEVSYSFLQKLLHNTFLLKVDPNTMGIQTINCIGSEKSCITNGVYVDILVMGNGIIHNGTLDGILFKYNFDSIEFELKLKWCLKYLGMPHIIKTEKRSDGQSRLKNVPITIKYSRKYSTIYVSTFKYFTVNRHFVDLERRINENSIKIKLKRNVNGYKIVN